MTPSQLHLLSPTYASIVASPALPSTTFTLARALALGKVALVGRKADKWGVWVGEVGLDRASGGVGEVMFTKDQTAKVLGPLHPTAAAAASTTPSEETPTSGNVAAAVNRTSSVGRTKHFGRLLQAADWEAVLQLVSDPSYAAGLPASSLTSLLSAVLDLPAPPPTLSKGKHAGSSVTAELVLGKLTATGLVRADDGEWRAAIGSLELEHVVVVLELLGRWVAMLADVEKEAQWTEVGKGLPTLAEVRFPPLPPSLIAHTPDADSPSFPYVLRIVCPQPRSSRFSPSCSTRTSPRFSRILPPQPLLPSSQRRSNPTSRPSGRSAQPAGFSTAQDACSARASGRGLGTARVALRVALAEEEAGGGGAGRERSRASGKGSTGSKSLSSRDLEPTPKRMTPSRRLRRLPGRGEGVLLPPLATGRAIPWPSVCPCPSAGEAKEDMNAYCPNAHKRPRAPLSLVVLVPAL